ncbi:pyridoxamine 5'-phosphate oxidase family protein [Streptomyces sp. NPDC003691]
MPPESPASAGRPGGPPGASGTSGAPSGPGVSGVPGHPGTVGSLGTLGAPAAPGRTAGPGGPGGSGDPAGPGDPAGSGGTGGFGDPGGFAGISAGAVGSPAGTDFGTGFGTDFHTGDTGDTDTDTDTARAIELLGRVSFGRLATSMRAMPFVAPARHIVHDGAVLIRIHRGFGYHRACNGSVVAYGADSFHHGGRSVWSVQFIGTARIVCPTAEEQRLFGAEPEQADGEPFEPVFMRVEPQFVTLHTLDYCEEQPNGHAA